MAVVAGHHGCRPRVTRRLHRRMPWPRRRGRDSGCTALLALDVESRIVPWTRQSGFCPTAPPLPPYRASSNARTAQFMNDPPAPTFEFQDPRLSLAARGTARTGSCDCERRRATRDPALRGSSGAPEPSVTGAYCTQTSSSRPASANCPARSPPPTIQRSFRPLPSTISAVHVLPRRPERRGCRRPRADRALGG